MDTGLGARLVVVLTISAFFAWLAAFVIGLTSGDTTTAVVVRTALVLAVLVIATRVMVRRTTASPGLPSTVLVAAVLSYVLFPATWEGRSLVGQLVFDPGVITVLVDGVLWVTAVVLSGRSVEPRPAAVGYVHHA